MPKAGFVEGVDEPRGVLHEPGSVVREKRRRMVSGQLLGVLSGDRQPAARCVEPVADPPRRTRAGVGDAWTRLVSRR
jgi:hypothetical protein